MSRLSRDLSREKKAQPRSLSADELQDLLLEKRVNGREARIAAYRASGRVVDEDNAPINRELIWDPEQRTVSRREDSAPVRRLDKILLLVEVLAVFGILVLLGKSSAILRRMNRESAMAMTLPTLTPTALIRSVVLPGGHTAPNEGGESGFNESEIPEHLRSVILRQENVPTPFPQADPIVRVRIAAIDVDAPVVWGDDWESLKKGVGLNAASGKAGEAGNVILSAHNDIYGELFRDLDQLNPGDIILLLTEKNAYTYTVTGTRVVRPDQTEVMAQTADSTLTLISCYPYLVDDKRIVVSAKYRE